MLVWCQHWLAMLAAACISILIVGSSVQVSMMKSTRSYLVTPWNVDSSNYEESYIFRDILSSNIADVARIAVIRSQLETKGVYDPEKVIDVTAYVNRAGSLSGAVCNGQILSGGSSKMEKIWVRAQLCDRR